MGLLYPVHMLVNTLRRPMATILRGPLLASYATVRVCGGYMLVIAQLDLGNKLHEVWLRIARYSNYCRDCETLDILDSVMDVVWGVITV